MSSMSLPLAPLTSLANPRVKAATALRERRERDQTGLTLIDGARELRRALDAGAVIVERHAHTRVVPGSAAERGQDATVFWNYVDLRCRFSRAVRIEARLVQ